MIVEFVGLPKSRDYDDAFVCYVAEYVHFQLKRIMN